MSRSYRHSNYVKCCGDKSYKKVFNRRLRRSSKYSSPDSIPAGNAYRKLNESYDIVDYRFDSSWEEFRKWNTVDGSEEEAYAKWKRTYKSK